MTKRKPAVRFPAPEAPVTDPAVDPAVDTDLDEVTDEVAEPVGGDAPAPVETDEVTTPDEAPRDVDAESLVAAVDLLVDNVAAYRAKHPRLVLTDAQRGL